MPLKEIAANAFELGLVALGWFLIWRLQFSAAAREKRQSATASSALPRWNVDGTGFAFCVLTVCVGWLIANVVMGQLLQRFPSLKTDEALLAICNGTLTQLGLLSGVLAGLFYLQQTTPHTSAPQTTPTKLPATSAPKFATLRAALATFTITVAVVIPVQAAWKFLLELCHLPTTNQEMVEIFFRTSSPPRVVMLATMAVVLAPVVEELVFRSGLFRFLRSRTPLWIALVLPALIFASLHVNFKTFEGLITLAPLTAFGIIFSLAYERTGRIAVVMIAHGLFNLHTVVFLLLGLTN